ncbi:MAG: DUF1150 family protein [Pseudomonadota bacterium]
MFPVENEKSGKPIVYVREADPEDLPDHLKNAPGKFFAVHDPEGKRLALTEDRNVAFALARQNDLDPVSAH